MGPRRRPAAGGGPRPPPLGRDRPARLPGRAARDGGRVRRERELRAGRVRRRDAVEVPDREPVEHPSPERPEHPRGPAARRPEHADPGGRQRDQRLQHPPAAHEALRRPAQAADGGDHGPDAQRPPPQDPRRRPQLGPLVRRAVDRAHRREGRLGRRGRGRGDRQDRPRREPARTDRLPAVLRPAGAPELRGALLRDLRPPRRTHVVPAAGLGSPICVPVFDEPLS